MLVKLKLLRGSNAGKEIPIKKPSFVIGRSEECNLRVNSDAISRKHCEILVSKTGVTVEDFGSKNGTYINGQRTEGVQPLSMGDQLRVGPLEFLVTISQPVPVKKAAPAADDEFGGMISDWLSEESDAPKIDAETREYRFDDTDEVPVSPSSVTQELPAVKQEQEEPKKKTGPSPMKSKKAPAPKDTQEAAAQTLRKFFNRGG
ncbi:MAG: FHA domain-containing protein [Planctomycetales bacterium]|nr:FHA domain-containing protein [Planctomycetales bacterium]